LQQYVANVASAMARTTSEVGLMRKAFAITLVLLAGILLAVLPVAAAEPSGNGSSLLVDLYHLVIEWFGEPDGLADAPCDSTPPDALTGGSGGNSGGPDHPEVVPHIPPGG
jgi:hypothetical protein